MNIAKSTSTARAVIAEVLAVRGPSKYGGRRSITHALSSNQHIFSTTQRASSTSAQSLPRVAQPSLWQSIIPKFLRRREPGSALVFAKGPRSKEWNPATFYIIIFLLIGSQAIQIIALRNEVTAYTRKADAKIRLLKEVIERVHQGEDVDVRGLLGTGDRSKEKEWEDVLREIEEEDALWQKKSRRKDSANAEESLDRDTSLRLSTNAEAKDIEERESRRDVGQSFGKRVTPNHGFY